MVGASGSGKSSLVWAGVLPALQDAHPDWDFLPRMVPGSNPLEALAASLCAAIPGALVPSLTRELGAEGDVRARALTQLIGQIATASAAQRVVLFIDQFEELFTLTDEEPTRQRFIDLLTAAVSERDGALTAILTLRADFYDRPLNYPSLGRLMERCAKDVLSLSLNDLYEVIQRPAALDTARLSFDDGLVAEMVFRVHEQAGALPLLQYTLDQLFEMRQGLKLTWEAYRLLGGVNGVLPKLAQQTYERLPPEEQRLARALFLRLIEPGATEQDTTRRRATLMELELPDPVQAKAIAEAAEAFTAARLLVKDSHDGVDTIEVAHEALIREWPTLRDWLTTARSDLVFQRAISAAASAWAAARRQPDDAGRLYRASMLADAEDWAKRAAPSSEEMAFIQASAAYQATQILAEERRIAELRSATRARRRWVMRAGAVAALAVITIAIAAIASIIAFQDRLAAETRENQANTAVAEAQETLAHVPETITGAQAQVAEAQAQVVAANATLTVIPATLTQVAHAVATGEVRLTKSNRRGWLPWPRHSRLIQ